MKIANKFVNVTRKRYGNSADCLSQIMERVGKPAICMPVRFDGAAMVANKKELAATQWPLLLAAIQAYWVTPAAALLLLVVIPPWWIEA